MQMNHAELFTRIDTKKPQRDEENKELVEMLKITCDQLIALQEVVEDQSAVIDAMQSEINLMRKKQIEIAGDVDLAMIDQSDVNKQLRLLKETVNANKIISNMDAQMPEAAPAPMAQEQNLAPEQHLAQEPVKDRIEEEIEKNFYPKLENSRLFFKKKNTNESPASTSLPSSQVESPIPDSLKRIPRILQH